MNFKMTFQNHSCIKTLLIYYLRSEEDYAKSNARGRNKTNATLSASSPQMQVSFLFLLNY